MNPAKADRLLHGAGVLLLALRQADFGQIIDGVGYCFVPEGVIDL